MASGTIISNTGVNLNLYVVWQSTPNTIENYSTVTINVYVRHRSISASANKSAYITCDGQTVNFTTPALKQSSNDLIDTLIGTRSFRVAHENNGTKTINISCGWYFNGTYSGKNIGWIECSKNISLDAIDRTATQLQVSISDITQIGATAELITSNVIDGWSYSLDNGNTWREWGEANSNYVSIIHTIFNSYTTYYVKYRVRKKSNHIVTTSGTFVITTLPIYIEEIKSEDNIEIDVGKTLTNYYTIYPTNASIKTLDIKSSNNDIVSVDGDKLTALNKGTSTITLTAKDGSNVSKNIIVSAIQRVTGILTNETEIVIPKGSSLELQYTIIPNNADNKNVFIMSDDESIVKISGNTIIGVENGSTTITIITEDGEYSTTILASVFGDYVWYDYSSPIEILNATDIQKIKSNILTIRSMLLSISRVVEPLKNIEAKNNIFLNNIFDTLQNLEYNLDIISDNDIRSVYYGEPKTVGDYALNREDIWRWVQILNDMYLILTGVFGKWQYLILNDGIPTINGKPIIMRGAKVG